MAISTKTIVTGGDFPGFTEEAFAFLRKLKKNNDRDWFVPRKAIFEEQLQGPMTQLMLAIEAEMKKNKLPLLTKPKGVLSRIYRDIRFSADKSPYHTFVSGALHRNGKKDAAGALYLHMGEAEQFAAAGFWQPERPVLTQWRLRMQEEPKEFLGMVRQLKSKKLELENTHRLQRMPRGFEAEDGSAIGEFLRYQSFILVRKMVKEEVLSKELPKIVAKFAMGARPLLEYGWGMPEGKKEMFLD
jgi:uncharacterized protein (TIGR02453 family)